MKYYAVIGYRTIELDINNLSCIDIDLLKGSFDINIYVQNISSHHFIAKIILGQQYSAEEFAKLNSVWFESTHNRYELLERIKRYPGNKGYVRCITKTWFVVEKDWYVIPHWGWLKYIRIVEK